MCDIRLMAQSARMSEAYIKVGLVPGDGGCYYLPRLVGMGKALELLWTGAFVGSEEARRLGLVSHVYPDDKFADECRMIRGRDRPAASGQRADDQASRVPVSQRRPVDRARPHLVASVSGERHP